MTTPCSVSIESLLAQRAWVSRVARALVAGESDADDLEQEVWLRALEHRPRDQGAIRSWFRTVLRREARDLWRSRTRRQRAEEAVPVAPTDAPTADLVAEADAHRRVVDAVMTLDDPYRTTIVLRYFHELAVSEVARRTGVPRETARTRLRRGLTLLRDRFDAESGGRRDAWIAAVLPLTRHRVPESVALSSAASTTGVLVVAAALLGSGALLFARSESPTEAVAPTSATRERTPKTAEAGPAAPRPWALADDPAEVAEARDGSADLRRAVDHPAAFAARSTSTAVVSDAFDEAFAVVNDPGEADTAKLLRAIGLLRGLVAARVREGQCRVGIGRCLFRLGRREESRAEFETALALGGFGPFTRSWAWLRLGCIADLDGRRAEAEGHYRDVLGLPDAPNLDPQKSRASLFLERPYAGYAVDR